MMQYPNQYYQSNQMCNTENCKRCYKKQGCLKYLSYLENIVSTPIPTVTPTLPDTTQLSTQSEINEIPIFQSNIDLTSFDELFSSYQNSITELITINSNNSKNIADKFKALFESNNGLVYGLSEMKNIIIELNEKISKLDILIDMIEVHNAKTGNVEPKGNSVTIYPETSEPEKVLVSKTKKGFFGLGKEKTTWVEETS